MHPASKITVTLLLLVLLGSLGAADYYGTARQQTAAVTEDDSKDAGHADDAAMMAGVETDTGNAGMQPNFPSRNGVAKNQGLSPEQAAAHVGLTMHMSEELTLLQQIVTEPTTVSSAVLLYRNDRAGTVAWLSSADVKSTFTTLKEALISAFSPDVTDLHDETVMTPGTPVRNVLRFRDPNLSEERIVFIRVRERLFEFHIADGHDTVMHTFIELLTTQ